MTHELVIIGAGISGLAAALEAREAGLEDVLILDHEKTKGGMLSKLFDSEEFGEEKQLLEQSASLPYPIKLQWTVTGFFPGGDGESHRLLVQTPEGAGRVEASRVLICSGALEKPREGNWIAGTRPAGVMTPTLAAGLLARGYIPGHHVLVIETGRISRATAKLLEKVTRVDRLPGEEWEVVRIGGLSRLSSVELRERSTGNIRMVECDTLVYANRRIPGTFFLKGSEVERDERQAILVDESGKTNIENVHAAGTCTNRGDDDHLCSIASGRQTVRALLGLKG